MRHPTAGGWPDLILRRTDTVAGSGRRRVLVAARRLGRRGVDAAAGVSAMARTRAGSAAAADVGRRLVAVPVAARLADERLWARGMALRWGGRGTGVARG